MTTSRAAGPRALTCVLVTLALGVTLGVSTGCKRHTGDVDGGVDGSALADGGDDEAGADAEGEPQDAGDVELRLPPATSDELTARGRHLLEAISQGNPDLAGDMLLARDAYQRLKDESDPARSYDRKVAPGFARAVATLHKRTKGVDGAQFVSFEIGGSITQASASGTRRHEWKRPLWRAHHAKLVFTVGGKLERIDVSELVAWRGSWYVLRLR